MEHNSDLYAASILERVVRKTQTDNAPSLHNYFQTNCRSVVIPILLKSIGATLEQFVWTQFYWLGIRFSILSSWLKAQHFFPLRNFNVSIQHVSKEAIFWSCTLKELFLMNLSKNISKRAHFDQSYTLATILKMCFVTDVFLGNWSKIYKAATLANLFQCIRSKSQWSTHPVVFFNSLMLVIKPGSLSLRFA